MGTEEMAEVREPLYPENILLARSYPELVLKRGVAAYSEVWELVRQL